MNTGPRDSALPAPRWGHCPADGQLHLLGPTSVLEATVMGCAHALCGQVLFAAGLTLSVSTAPGSLCVRCLAAGTAS